jgi:hypothetical protein
MAPQTIEEPSAISEKQMHSAQLIARRIKALERLLARDSDALAPQSSMRRTGLIGTSDSHRRKTDV